KRVDGIEALEEERRQRPDVDDAEPQERRQEEEERQKLRPPPEVRRQPVARPPCRMGGIAHAPSPITCSAAASQASATSAPTAGTAAPAGTRTAIPPSCPREGGAGRAPARSSSRVPAPR